MIQGGDGGLRTKRSTGRFMPDNPILRIHYQAKSPVNWALGAKNLN
jgi:hypothetical protein